MRRPSAPGRADTFVTTMATTMLRLYGPKAATHAAEMAQVLKQTGMEEGAERWIEVCFALCDRVCGSTSRAECTNLSSSSSRPYSKVTPHPSGSASVAWLRPPGAFSRQQSRKTTYAALTETAC